MSHAGGGQGGLPPMIGSPTSRFFGRTSSHSPAAAAAAAAAVPSPFLPAPQPQGDLMPASPAAGGAGGGAAVGAVTGAGQVDLAALADQPPARCFVVQMMDVVWQIERGSNGARKPDIAPHRRIMLRPASLKDFQDAVYVWAGVQPGKVRTVHRHHPRSDCAAEISDRSAGWLLAPAADVHDRRKPRPSAGVELPQPGDGARNRCRAR